MPSHLTSGGSRESPITLKIPAISWICTWQLQLRSHTSSTSGAPRKTVAMASARSIFALCDAFILAEQVHSTLRLGDFGFGGGMAPGSLLVLIGGHNIPQFVRGARPSVDFCARRPCGGP
jgi:hypothetical protein